MALKLESLLIKYTYMRQVKVMSRPILHGFFKQSKNFIIVKNLIGVATLQLYRKIYAFSEKVVNMFSTRFYPKFSNLVILARGGTRGGARNWCWIWVARFYFCEKTVFRGLSAPPWCPPLNFRCGFDKNFLYLFFAILRGGTRGGTSDTEVIFWPKKAVKLYWDLGMWLKIAPCGAPPLVNDEKSMISAF